MVDSPPKKFSGSRLTVLLLLVLVPSVTAAAGSPKGPNGKAAGPDQRGWVVAILNERVFYNEGRAERVPLTVVFAASNEPPGDESLAALYDRFPLRIHCPSVDQNRIGDLLERSWEDAFDRQFGGGQAVPRFACANDLRLLHRVMRAIYGGRGVRDVGHPGRGDFRNEFVRAFGSLRKDYNVSDRTIAALLAFARAKALLDGKDHLTVDELDVFKHVAWDQTGELERLVNSIKKGYRM